MKYELYTPIQCIKMYKVHASARDAYERKNVIILLICIRAVRGSGSADRLRSSSCPSRPSAAFCSTCIEGRMLRNTPACPEIDLRRKNGDGLADRHVESRLIIIYLSVQCAQVVRHRKISRSSELFTRKKNMLQGLDKHRNLISVYSLCVKSC